VGELFLGRRAAMASGAWASPDWREVAFDYRKNRAARRSTVEIEPERLTQLRRLMADDVSLDRAWHELKGPRNRRGSAAATAVEALVYSLRRAVDVLAEPDAVRRLAKLSDDQLLEVGERLRRFKPEIARVWSADDVAVLMQVRERLK
jgi:hypothetical protein